MNTPSILSRSTAQQRDEALQMILEQALKPALGSLPKRELELLILEAPVRVGYLDPEPKIYDLV